MRRTIPARVRITAAYPEADIAAAIQPGMAAVRTSMSESREQIRQIDDQIGRWERLRGIRPGTVAIEAAVETVRGVTEAHAIAAASPRVRALTTRTAYLALSLGIAEDEDADPMHYARGECELAARELELEAVLTERTPSRRRRARRGAGTTRRVRRAFPEHSPSIPGPFSLRGRKGDENLFRVPLRSPLPLLRERAGVRANPERQGDARSGRGAHLVHRVRRPASGVMLGSAPHPNLLPPGRRNKRALPLLREMPPAASTSRRQAR